MSDVTQSGLLSPADHLAATAVVHELCAALDHSDAAGFVNCFVEDGVYQVVSSPATGEELRYCHRGPAQLLAFAESAIATRKGLARHWTGNLRVWADPDDADRARASSYVLLVVIDPESGDRRIAISGTHRDELVRTDGGWRFVGRTVVADL